MIPRRTYLPSIIVLACSKAEIIIEPVLENMNFSYLAQNHSSLTRNVKCIKLLNFMIQSRDIEFTQSTLNTLYEFIKSFKAIFINFIYYYQMNKHA